MKNGESAGGSLWNKNLCMAYSLNPQAKIPKLNAASCESWENELSEQSRAPLQTVQTITGSQIKSTTYHAVTVSASIQSASKNLCCVPSALDGSGMCVHSKYFSFNKGTCCNKGLLKLIPYSSTSFSSLFSSRVAAAVFTSSNDAHALNPPTAAKHVSDPSLIRSTDAHKSSSEEDESLLLLLDDDDDKRDELLLLSVILVVFETTSSSSSSILLLLLLLILLLSLVLSLVLVLVLVSSSQTSLPTTYVFSIFSAFLPCEISRSNATVASFPLYFSSAPFPPGCEKELTFSTAPLTTIKNDSEEEVSTSSRVNNRKELVGGGGGGKVDFDDDDGKKIEEPLFFLFWRGRRLLISLLLYMRVCIYITPK